MIGEKYKKIVAEKGKSQWLSRKSDVQNFLFFLKKHFKDIKGLKVLDAGCAQGRDSNEISINGLEVLGLDYDENFIKEAKKEYPSLKFEIGKIEDLSYPDESFDAVYCVNTLFYTDINKSLPELSRVLKSNGILFITLDEKIVNLDENKIIHSLDVDQAIKNLKNLKLLSKEYAERTDEVPFKHTHHFYHVVFIKQ